MINSPIKAVTLTLSLIALLAVGCNRGGGTTTPSKTALNQLAIGIPKTEAERILSTSGIEYSWYEKEHSFYAIERDVEIKNFTSTSHQWIIAIGSDDRVATIKINRKFTGP